MFGKRNKEHELIASRVKACSVFSTLQDSDISALMKIAHIRDFSADERVFTEGTVGLCFYIIIKGSVSMVSPGSGEENVIREFKEGDFFSEIHLFAETNHSVTCISRDITRLVVFSKPDIEDLVKINPKLGNRLLLRFLDFLGQKLDEMHRENITLKYAKN